MGHAISWYVDARNRNISAGWNEYIFKIKLVYPNCDTYYYAVSAVNPIGESNLSEVVSIEISKEKENGIPSLDFVWGIGAMAIVMFIKHRRKKR